MRLFFGLPVPSQTAESLALVARALPLRDARLTSPANMHVTLVFLGSVAEERLPAILQELDGLQPPVPGLRLGGLGTFARAGVLFAAIEPAPALLELQTTLARAMQGCGFTLEERPYHPHLTLARLRGPIRLTPRQLELPASAPRGFSADCVNLYKSITTPAGSVYQVLAQRQAAGSP